MLKYVISLDEKTEMGDTYTQPQESAKVNQEKNRFFTKSPPPAISPGGVY
jgi:hypothetical protein